MRHGVRCLSLNAIAKIRWLSYRIAARRLHGRLGVSDAPHRHALTDEDWAALLDLSDRSLLGWSVARRVDEFPDTHRWMRLAVSARTGAALRCRTCNG